MTCQIALVKTNSEIASMKFFHISLKSVFSSFDDFLCFVVPFIWFLLDSAANHLNQVLNAKNTTKPCHTQLIKNIDKSYQKLHIKDVALGWGKNKYSNKWKLKLRFCMILRKSIFC